MEENIIALRPHHVERFLGYYHKWGNLLNIPLIQKEYGAEFIENAKYIFNMLASGGKGSEQVFMKNGLDSLCKECSIKDESCSAPDSKYIYLIKQLDLKEGEIYPIKEFLEKIEQFTKLE